jgi:MFS family permease
MIALMLLGGVFADRFRRNRIVGGSDILGALFVGTSALSLISGYKHLWVLVLMGALFGILNALWWPAMSGVLPEIVPRESLQKANAFVGLTSNIGNVSGTLLGGVIVATFNPGWGLFVDSISFLIAGIIVWNLELPMRNRGESKGMFHELRSGWREFISRSWVLTLVITFAAINMAFESLLQVLGPLNFKDPSFGPRAWSYNLAALTVGMMVGGYIVLKKKFKRPMFVVMILIALSVIWDFSLALSLPLYITVTAAVLSGITVEMFVVTWNTSLQHHIPEESFSRVNSYDAVGSYGIAPLGIVFAGPLANHFGVSTMLWATGTITLVAALGSLTVRSVRELRND